MGEKPSDLGAFGSFQNRLRYINESWSGVLVAETVTAALDTSHQRVKT